MHRRIGRVYNDRSMKETGLEGYEYFAFISYSSKDAKFAAKLQRHLEKYRLPVFLSRQYPRTPRRLQPIFRDRTDLEQGNLGEMLVRGLSVSKFLIVICSENSARANRYGKRYVDMEVESFVALNPDVNRVRVIPVIYREKGGARATECLPPAVKALDLLALDVLDKGYAQVYNQIVSRMVGIKPGILWNRWQKERRLSMAGTVAVIFLVMAVALVDSGVSALISIVAALLLVGIGAYFAWRYVTPRVINYERFIEENNLPVGINKLSDEEVAHRACHYRFTYSKWRLRKVECCNSAGVPVVQKRPGFTHDEVSSIEILYDEKGYVNRQIWRDEHGVILREVLFDRSTKNDWMTFRTAGGDFSASHRPDSSAAVTRYRLQRNTQGHITEVIYCNNAGLPTADSDGTWGRHYEIDASRGLITARYYLGKNGAPQLNRFGVAGRTYEYDDKGRMLSYTNIDTQGRPAYEQLGYATMRCKMDEWGNRTEVSYHASDGELCVCDDMKEGDKYPGRGKAMKRGMAIKRMVYNECGYQVSELYFNTQMRPCLSRYQIARCDSEVNSQGLIIAQSYYDTEGKPCFSAGQYHKVTRTLDAYGNRTGSRYFDLSGAPCYSRTGVHHQCLKYDEEGRVRCVEFFNADGKPCRFDGKYFRSLRRYDERGNQIECSFYDENGVLCNNEYGFARRARAYDEHGNVIHGAYYDAEGKSCFRLQTRVSSWENEFDRNNNRIREKHFGIDGKPCLDVNGVAIEEWTYNDAGQRTSVAYRGVNGMFCLCKDGYAREEWELDSVGNRLTSTTYDANGNMCCGKRGYAQEQCSYNEVGLVMSRRYLNHQAEPIMVKGAAYITYEYDDKRNLVRKCTFDTTETPVADENGVAVYIYEYDDRGRLIAESFLRIDGTPCLGADMAARIEHAYDERGHHTRSSYFDTGGKPCISKKKYATICWERNHLDKATKISFFNEAGKPMKVNGRAVALYQYDDRGNRLGGQYFDEDGKPSVTDDAGVSSFTCEYDNNNNKIKECCYGADGKPCLNKNGAAIEEWTYNAFNQRTSVTYRGTNGELRLCKSGYARMLTLYDDYGRKSGTEYRDAANNPCMVTNEETGIREAKYVVRYDRNNRISIVKHYNEEGKLCNVTNKRGKTYAYVFYTYDLDAEGFPRRRASYYDENRKRVKPI